MRISLNWIKENYIEFISSPEDIASNLTALGLECNIIKDEITYEGVILGKVLEVKPLEESDHLKLCEVDIGKEILSIICGAGNVQPDILVPVAPIGGSLGNGSFIIKKAKLCGRYSNGMICSEKELDISDRHEGIMILDSNEELGTPIKDILHSAKDVGLDIDLTPNRGDCLSHIGVSREIQIFDGGKYIYKNHTKLAKGNENSNEISIDIKDKVACRRYAAKIIKNVSIGPSPIWLKEKIESIGQKSINNVVDAANYVLFDIGHPIHTFDLSKIQGNKIKVRYADNGEKIVTLDNKERVLSEDHLLICDEIKPIAIAGIIGGLNSEITESTKNILIESAYFDPTVIRKGSKKIDLSTEASRRFERDTDIDNVLVSINRLTEIIIEVAGGKSVDETIDVYPNNKEPKVIKLDINKCNQFLGTKLKKDDFENILRKLSIHFIIKNDIFTCTIPLYRNDLSREVDLYEEVARVFGYDNIPIKSSFTIPFDSIKNDKYNLIDETKRYFSDSGFNEHYSNSLLHMDKINLFIKDRSCVKISNPLSNEMEYLRDSILPGLVLASSYNEKRMNNHYKLFEVGTVHWVVSEDKYMQENSIGFLWSDNANKHWRNTIDFDLSMVKGELSSFFSRFGFGGSIVYKETDNDSFSISINGSRVGSLYSLNKKLLNAFEISNATILAELNLDILISLCTKEIIIHTPSHYPSSSRDIALLVDKKIKYKEIKNDIKKSGGDLLSDITLFDIYEGEDLGKKNRSLAISLRFISNKRTLKDEEIDKYIDNIITSLKKKLNIQQR